ncbi:MAG: glycosyltransferase family 4 protein [Ignavibacteriaceae bacterium]|nr:glycosyltransferase family 4 protein [Ignavibacteriaceae bacterium]
MKIAIVHDWLVTYAGSERCVESFTNIWPDADVYTLVDFLSAEDRKRILKDKIPVTSFLQNWRSARKNHRKYLALFPYAIEQFDLSKYDLIISSSHAVAKGVLTSSNQLHISYCHTPIRYAWDLTHQYLKESGLSTGLKGTIAKAILHYIRIWDAGAANRVDYFIANSKYIAGRIKKTYRRDAEVIYPPVDTINFPVQTQKDNYYLAASRFVPYKRIDLIVEAFSKMPDKRLLVIGEGSEEDKIKSKASANIEFLGYQPHQKLMEYMQKAKAFVFAADEDFGIMVVEALACGTPVIAFNKGGVSETILDGKTGILFDKQEPDSIKEAVERFEKNQDTFKPVLLSEYAKQFDRKVFEEKIKSFVSEKCNDFFNK